MLRAKAKNCSPDIVALRAKAVKPGRHAHIFQLALLFASIIAASLTSSLSSLAISAAPVSLVPFPLLAVAIIAIALTANVTKRNHIAGG